MSSRPWPTLYTSAISAERKERVSSQVLQQMLGIGVHWPVWAMWVLLDLGVQWGWLPLSHVNWERGVVHQRKIREQHPEKGWVTMQHSSRWLCSHPAGKGGAGQARCFMSTTEEHRCPIPGRACPGGSFFPLLKSSHFPLEVLEG